MTHVVLTPVTTLDVNEATIDLVGAGTSVDAADTFEILARGDTSNLLIFLNEEGTGAATVTFDAGADPPSLLEALGDLAITLAQADLKLVSLEPGRYVQGDGKVTGSVATNDTLMYVVRQPREQ